MKSYVEVAGPGHPLLYKLQQAGDLDAFLVDDYYCDNPDCPGWELEVTLTALTPEQRRIDIRVDFDSNKMSTPKGLPEEDHAVASRFCHEKTNIDRLFRRRQLVRAWGMANLSPRRGPKRRFTGDCYSLGDFDKHKQQYVMGFKVGPDSWAAMDQYCVNPHCACFEAMLSFFLHASGSKRVEPTFSARLDLATGEARSLDATRLPRRQEDVVQTFLADMDDWKRELTVRRMLLRQIAAEHVELPGGPGAVHPTRPAASSGSPAGSADAVRSSVGRNDPCTCGSGKKFKKCCGTLRA